MMNKNNVIMIHSVGSSNTDWCDKWLSLKEIHFEKLCAYLSKNKYKTDFLDRWYYCQNNPNEQSDKEVFLTFDDGYLDNLLIAYPILKKYNLKATIFINPEFVDPSSGIRDHDYLQKNGPLGFLNWDEIIFLDSTSVFDVQSHSMSHNFYFCSDKIIDIYEGQNKYHWLNWIEKPAEKMFWQKNDQKNLIPFGTPIFEYSRALGLKRYFPSEKLINFSINLYQNQYKSKDEILLEIKNQIKVEPGFFESEKSQKKRYKYELFESKRILEEKLKKSISYLCWPGGGYNKLSLRLAQEAGYKASTISSKDVSLISNYNVNYKRIKRYGMSSVLSKKNGEIRFVKFSNYLIWKLRAKEGSFIYRSILILIKRCL